MCFVFFIAMYFVMLQPIEKTTLIIGKERKAIILGQARLVQWWLGFYNSTFEVLHHWHRWRRSGQPEQR